LWAWEVLRLQGVDTNFIWEAGNYDYTFVIKTVLAQRGQHNFLSYWPEVGTLAHRKGKRRGGVDLTFKEKKPSI
jgi:hypothetical protein